jgi:hypothetical protein
MCHLADARVIPACYKVGCADATSCRRGRFLVTALIEKGIWMNESIQRLNFLAGAQLSCFIGILFSCFTGILLIGVPLDLVATKVVIVEQAFLSEFISWLLLFCSGALLAGVGAWGSNLATPGYQPIRLRSIIAVSEITAIVVAIAAALAFSRFPMVLDESLYGEAQPHILTFFVGVLVIALSTSLSTWRFREGLAKGVAVTAGLLVLGLFAVAILATAVYLLFSLVPNL